MPQARMQPMMQRALSESSADDDARLHEYAAVPHAGCRHKLRCGGWAPTLCCVLLNRPLVQRSSMSPRFTMIVSDEPPTHS